MAVYRITTDASYNHKTQKISYAFVITLPSIERIFGSGNITNTCHSATEAEMMAVGHAIECLKNRLPIGHGDIVYIHTDCAISVRYFTREQGEGRNHRLGALEKLIYGMITNTPGLRHRFIQSYPDHPALKWCDTETKRLTKLTEF